MKIALTHNLQKTSREEEAEFDTPETVETIAKAILACGHEVIPVEVTCPLPVMIDKLRSAEPDLVFNTAEGLKGKAREAVFPAVFEELGLPYTGSDAWTLMVTLDKHLTKVLVEAQGVRVPWHVFLNSNGVDESTCPLPCIVKPNFEGSSRGITDESVVFNSARLNDTVGRALRAHPEGVIVEEYISGTDVTVPYLEGLDSEALTPCSYEIHRDFQTRYGLYDYRLKHDAPLDAVGIACPAKVPPTTLREAQDLAKRCAAILRVRGFARFDFRVRDDSSVFFLEANATPSMEEGASMFVAALQLGMSYEQVIGHVITLAAEFWSQQGMIAGRA